MPTTTETTGTSPDAMERHVAFKFCLDPTQEQLRALARDGGASRFAYNMLVGYNAEVMRTRNEYWAKRHDEGATDDEIKAELKALSKENSKFKTLGYMAFGKMLTAEVARHRACAKAIEEGTPVEEVWGANERSKEPWLHTAKRRVLSSGTQSADSALKNFLILALVSVLAARWAHPSLRAAPLIVTRSLSLRRKQWVVMEPRTYVVSLLTIALRQA